MFSWNGLGARACRRILFWPSHMITFPSHPPVANVPYDGWNASAFTGYTCTAAPAPRERRRFQEISHSPPFVLSGHAASLTPD